MNYEDGFHFHSFSSLSGATKSLIVILHGYGSHPDKYLKWAKKTQEENPDADVLVVRAPVPLKTTTAERAARNLSGVEDLYTWYPLSKKGLKQASLVLRHAFNRLKTIHALNKMIDNQLAQRGLRDENLAFIGFSMGGAVAVQTALKRKNPCAAVVCHSGAVLPFTKAKKKPDTLMIMGDQDDIFFLPKMKKKPAGKRARVMSAFSRSGSKIDLHHSRSVKRLKKSGIAVTEKIFPGQDHRITEESWREASSFVAQKLKPKK